MGFQAMGKDILSLPDCTAKNMQSDLFCSLHRKSQPKSGWLSVACVCLSFVPVPLSGPQFHPLSAKELTEMQETSPLHAPLIHRRCF